jgi:hypothetical protein
MKMHIKKDTASQGRGRMAQRVFDEEEGPGAAVRLRGASPESLGRATSGGAKSSSGRACRRLAKGEVSA